MVVVKMVAKDAFPTQLQHLRPLGMISVFAKLLVILWNRIFQHLVLPSWLV